MKIDFVGIHKSGYDTIITETGEVDNDHFTVPNIKIDGCKVDLTLVYHSGKLESVQVKKSNGQ